VLTNTYGSVTRASNVGSLFARVYSEPTRDGALVAVSGQTNQPHICEKASFLSERKRPVLDEEGISASVRVSSRPEKIRKKQDDHESASHFKLLEEPRQKISEDETFEAVYQGRNYESKRSKAGIRFRGWGSEEENGNSREPGKDEKHQRFADHSPTCRSFLGFVSTLFAHKPKIAVPILTVERKRQRSTSRLIRRAIHGRNSDYHGAISLPRAGRYLL
jgi:hypothetical protein